MGKGAIKLMYSRILVGMNYVLPRTKIILVLAIALYRLSLTPKLELSFLVGSPDTRTFSFLNPFVMAKADTEDEELQVAREVVRKRVFAENKFENMFQEVSITDKNLKCGK